MKKHIFSILAVLAFTAGYSQFTYGPKVGLNMARFSEDQMMPGMQLGGFLSAEIVDRIGLQADFLWSMKGTKNVSKVGTQTLTKTTYFRIVDVPICLYFPISKHIRGFIGPQINVFRKGHETSKLAGKTEEKDLKGAGMGSWCFGFDLNLESPLVFGFRFATNKFSLDNGDPTQPVNPDPTAAQPAYRLNAIMFNIAYKMDW